jgi:hypothetical protein
MVGLWFGVNKLGQVGLDPQKKFKLIKNHKNLKYFGLEFVWLIFFTAYMINNQKK